MKTAIKLVLLIAGFCVALHLLLFKWHLMSLAYCPTYGCDIVNTSAYSSILGVPVAMIGAIGYLVLAIAVTLQRRFGGLLQLYRILLVAAFLFSTYLTFTEVFLIHHICFWCVLSYSIITMLTLVEVVGAISSRQRNT